MFCCEQTRSYGSTHACHNGVFSFTNGHQCIVSASPSTPTTTMTTIISVPTTAPMPTPLPMPTTTTSVTSATQKPTPSPTSTPTTQVTSSTETRTLTVATTATLTSTSTLLSATTTTLQDENEIWPVVCGPPCRCSYWRRSARLRFDTIGECQAHAEESGHMFFTYNPRNGKCVSSNSCFYNTLTANPNSQWYQNSLQWRAHKSPRSQSRGIRMSSNEFISPDPDYMDEAEEEVDAEAVASFEFEEPLELSNAERKFQGCSVVIFTMLWMFKIC